jgi:hypothetical protein
MYLLEKKNKKVTSQMKTLKQFIKEQKQTSDTPYGVLFLKDKNGNDTHAIVGTPHHDSPEIPQHVLQRIDAIKQKHGMYYEGDGGDVKYHHSLFGTKKEYVGSWQGIEINRKKPPEWIHTVLFSNHKENDAVGKIMGHHQPGDTIVDTIRRSGYNLATFETKGGPYQPSKDDLHNFLNKVGMGDDANKPSTEKNLGKFLNRGEKRMWPKDWLTNKGAAPSAAREMVYSRQDNIFNKPGGVFIAGAGHVPAAEQRAKDSGIPHEKIGGEKAN